MVWWQELLVYIVAAAISLMAGLLVGSLIGRAFLKVWARRKPIISNNNPNKLGILINRFHNRHREVQIITASAKSEEQNFSPAYENKRPLTEQETSLQANFHTEEIIKPPALDKAVRDIRQAENQIKNQAGTNWNGAESVPKSPLEAKRITRKVKTEKEEVDQAHTEKTLPVSKVEEQAKHEAMVPLYEISQRMAELYEAT